MGDMACRFWHVEFGLQSKQSVPLQQISVRWREALQLCSSELCLHGHSVEILYIAVDYPWIRVPIMKVFGSNYIYIPLSTQALDIR